VSLTVLSVSYPLAKVSPATAGGAEQVLATIDKALVRAGHRSLVLAPYGSSCSGLLIPAKVPNGLLNDDAKQESRRIFKQLIERALPRYSVDVIHLHGLDFWEYLPDGDTPVVVSLHLPLEWYPQAAISDTPPNLTLVSVSQFQARNASAACAIGAVIPNGVDLEEFYPSRRTGDYVLAMGRICPEKGLHLAIDAAAEARANLLLAGTVFEYPEHRAYFDSKIAARLNHHARFIGAVGGKRKRCLLAGAKCLLLPSQVQETSSLLAMEALACGTPVIAWRSGALPEIVSDGRTGFLVSSVAEMADAIAQVDEINRADCRREAEQRFDSQNMVSKYVELYESVVERNRERELRAA